MKNLFFILVIPILFLLASCEQGIKAGELYGKWKYAKVENPNASPPDSVTSDELAVEAPFIQFSKNNELMIMWGGKVISHGKFSTEGRNIQYTESLPDGTTRTFPFWVSKLTDKEIIFETRGTDGSRVTAVRDIGH